MAFYINGAARKRLQSILKTKMHACLRRQGKLLCQLQSPFLKNLQDEKETCYGQVLHGLKAESAYLLKTIFN